MESEIKELIEAGEGYHLEFKESSEKSYYRSKHVADEGLTPIEESSQKTSEKTSEKILSLIQANPEITIQELSAILNKTTRAIEMQMNKLKEKGKIIRSGPDKGGYWKVVKKDVS